MNFLKFNNNGSQASAMMQQANEVAKNASDKGIDVSQHLNAIDQARNNKDTNGFKYAIDALNAHVQNQISALNNQQQATTIVSRLDSASKIKGTDPNQIAAGIDAARRGDLPGASAIAAGIESQLGKSQLVQVESDVKERAKKIEEDEKIGIEKSNYIHNAKIFYDKLQSLTHDDIERLNGVGFFATGGAKFMPNEATRDAYRRYQAVEAGSKLLGIAQDRAAGMGARISNAAMQAASGNLVPFSPGMSVEGFKKARDEAAAVVKDIYHEGTYDKWRKDNNLPSSGGVENTSDASQPPPDALSGINANLRSIINKNLPQTQVQPAGQPNSPPTGQPTGQPTIQTQPSQQSQQPIPDTQSDSTNPNWSGMLNYQQFKGNPAQ